MFKLTSPCVTCPFRRGAGETFQLVADRLSEIFEAVSFQCHKTVDYDEFDDDIARQGAHPQQCAGLMSLLSREGRDNQIMQVGQRLGEFDPSKLDHTDVYGSIADAVKAHGG